ncbi:prolipoprotein diacylglyceryl transferase [Alkaliphilus crotonatoxidans]
MDPIAFTVFGIEIAWYGILIGLGMALGVVVATRRAKAENLPEDIIIDFCLVAVPFAVLCTRLYYVAFNWDYYGRYPSQIFNFRQGGLAIHGGIIGGVLACYFFCRYKKIGFWKMADICAPSLILGQAIGRWGNYFNQEAHGGPTDLPWGIMIDGVKVHPTFLYESLWNLAVFFFLLYYTKKKKFEGEIFIYYLILYSLARFFIEGLRTDSLMIGPLRTAQVISVLMIIGGLALRMILQKRKKALN